MTNQTQKPVALFPDCPREDKLVDEDKNATQPWRFFFDQLVNALQQNFNNERLMFPPLTAAEIATIQAVYTPLIGNPLPQETGGKFVPDISGGAVFDTTNRVPKMFIITYDGATPPNIVTAAWKTFTLT